VHKKRKSNDRSVQPGMEVEATRGDLGEADVSKPKVSDVARDVQGNVEKLTVEKGVVFKKKLEVPADRIQSVDRPAEGDKRQGKVLIEVSKQEADALTHACAHARSRLIYKERDVSLLRALR